MTKLSRWLNYFLGQRLHPTRKIVTKEEFEEEVYRIMDLRYGLDATGADFDTVYDEVLTRMQFTN